MNNGIQLWSHQKNALNKIAEKRRNGVRRLVVQGPTGSGKTITFLELIKEEIKNGGRAVVYTTRKVLREQISGVLNEFGVDHGVRAAGEHPSRGMPVQVSSLMTERSRVFGENAKWDLHDATLVIIDEAHSQKAGVARKVIAKHRKSDAFILGFSATPVGLSDIYEDIISMANLSELRAAGVLVPCMVYAPEECDMKGVRIVGGDYVKSDAAKRIKETIVFGNVLNTWERLNPAFMQTVLFAPGVKESRWFVEQFNFFGFKAAHIDAKTSQSERRRIFDAWSSGDIHVVSNFGIIREGFDLKSCQHAILAQPTRKLSTYVQMVGRIIRSSPGKEVATLQDHVGAYWMHGSPNKDRMWRLDDDDFKLRERNERERDQSEKLPSVCPKCGCVRYAIPGWYGSCPKCGYEGTPVERIVRQTNGDLIEVEHVTAEQRMLRREKELQDIAMRCVYAGANSRTRMLAKHVVGMATARAGQRITQSQLKIAWPHPKQREWAMPASAVWPWARRG